MTKKSVLVFFATFLFLSLFGQKKEFKSEWNIGIGGGPTFSSVDFESPGGKYDLKTKNLSQFFGGISVRYSSENHLGIIGELNYSQQGWAGDFPDNPEFVHEKKLTYLEIPILTHIYFGGKRVRFFINLGPKIAFMLSNSEKISDDLANHLASGNSSIAEPIGQYYTKPQKKFDYGIMAGLGLEFRTGIGNFSLEGRYYFGLGDIYKNSRSDYFGRSANRVIGAKLTYYVKLF